MAEAKAMKEKTMDMTRGNPLKQMLWFSIPLIIGNIFQQFYSMVDTIIVGRTIGVQALAAVGSSGALNFLILGFAMGLAGGFAIVVSQRFGAGDYENVRRSVAMGAMLSAAFAIVLTLLSALSARWLLEMMHTPQDIIDDAWRYLVIIFWGVPATMFYNYISSVIRALGDSKTPLYFLLVASILNIILDFVCILNFHMGVAGAAVATIFSQAVSGILCLIYVGKHFPVLRLKKSDWRFDRKFAWYHLRLGIPMAVQNSVIAVGGMAVQTILNGFGAIAVAGYTAASKIEQMVSQVMMSFGLTLATYTGQNYGAMKLERIRDGVKRITIILLLISAAGAGLMILFGRSLTHIFIDAGEQNVEEVVRYSRQYLNISVCFYPALSAIFIFRSALQGIGNTGIVLIGSAVELGCRLVGALVLSVPLGYMGVCFAGPFAWAGAAVLFLVIYIRDIRRLSKKFQCGEFAAAV